VWEEWALFWERFQEVGDLVRRMMWSSRESVAVLVFLSRSDYNIDAVLLKLHDPASEHSLRVFNFEEGSEG